MSDCLVFWPRWQPIGSEKDEPIEEQSLRTRKPYFGRVRSIALSSLLCHNGPTEQTHTDGVFYWILASQRSHLILEDGNLILGNRIRQNFWGDSPLPHHIQALRARGGEGQLFQPLPRDHSVWAAPPRSLSLGGGGGRKH